MEAQSLMINCLTKCPWPENVFMVNPRLLHIAILELRFPLNTESQDHRITESQNGRGWKGPLGVI